MIEYLYDPAGNIVQINRSTVTPGSPAILNFNPRTGGAGGIITISGQNFSTVAGNNLVQINGITANVISATSTQLIVQIPAGVTTSQVTVTVNGVTVTSGPNLLFTPAPVPSVTSVTPDGAVGGTTVPNVAVTGSGLTGAIFNFPSGAIVGSQNVNSGGASATMSITGLSNTRGAFPLVATTSAGSSTGTVTAANHFIVLLSPDEADGQVLSVLNTADPISQSADPTDVSHAADSQVVSVLNTVDPISQSADPTDVHNEADSALVSLNNTSTGSVRRGPPISARGMAREFAGTFSAAGSLQVAQSGSGTGLVAGQTLAIGIRAPRDAQEVELFVNGAHLATLGQRPFVFTLNVPTDVPALVFSATAVGDGGIQLASYGWQQQVVPDKGTTLSGRIVDESGNPVSGARVSVEATGLYGEFFELGGAPAAMPDLAQAKRSRAGLVSALDWLNPGGVFGQNPIGIVTTPAFAARFTGQFFAREAGAYSFAVNAQAAATLLIDGQQVARTVYLTPGMHSLEVSYLKGSGDAMIEALWIEPNGARAPIPQFVPLEGLSGKDPALAALTGSNGAFSIGGVPAKVDGLRVVLQLPDGRSATSDWTAPVNGAVTELGDVVVPVKEGK